MVRHAGKTIFSSEISKLSFLTKIKQQRVISATEMANGGSIVSINSPVGILNFVYKYRFCGLPNGVSIPPRLAAMFCIIKVNAMYFFLPVEDKTKYPSGRKVKSAMSLAINIEPIKVIYASARIEARVFLKILTIFCAKKKKKRMFFKAQTTASTQKRQVSVFQSK